MDEVVGGLVAFLAVLFIGFVIGSAFGQHEYTPSSTYKAVCRVQGGEPYKHVISDNKAVSTCIKNATTIPVVIP